MLLPPWFLVSVETGPLVAVVILKDKSAAALEQPGCQGTSCARGSRARVLVQESEEPAGAVGSAKEVVDQSVYFVVILVLLTAFIIGVSNLDVQGGCLPPFQLSKWEG